MARKPELPTGVSWRGPSLFAQVWIAGEKSPRTKRFAADTPIPSIVQWRELQRASAGPVPASGSFTADILAYLAKPKIAAQAYVSQKAGHLAAWETALGGQRSRRSFTQDEIEHVIQQWLAEGLAAATVYHRRATLLNLFVVLDTLTDEQIRAGMQPAPNPVIRTTCPPSWTPRDRSVPFEQLKKVYDTMPGDRLIKQGIRKPSIAKLVVGVCLHLGIRPADLKRVKKTDVDLAGLAVNVPVTLKGRRGKPITGASTYPVPLEPGGDALAAVRAFDAAGA